MTVTSALLLVTGVVLLVGVLVFLVAFAAEMNDDVP